MSRVIYADELVFINLIVNYFLLMGTAFISGGDFKRKRILAGALVGGLSSLMVLIPDLNAVLSLIIRLILSALIVLCSFECESLKRFFRRYLSFFVVNFIFSGAMLGIWLIFRPERMFYDNGAVYFDINTAALVLMSVSCYLIITLFTRILRRRIPRETVCTAELSCEGVSVRLPALLDTGSSLRDSFTGKPVLVARYDAVRALLPEALEGFFCGGSLSDCVIPNQWSGKLRLIPFKTVGKSGLLPSFKCDRVDARSGSMRSQGTEVFIGITTDRIAGGEYELILSGNFFDYFGDTDSRFSQERDDNVDRSCAKTGGIYAEGKNKTFGGGNLLHKRSADASATADKGGGGAGDGETVAWR